MPGDPLADVEVLMRPRFVMLGGAIYRWGDLAGPAGGLAIERLRSLAGGTALPPASAPASP